MRRRGTPRLLKQLELAAALGEAGGQAIGLALRDAAASAALRLLARRWRWRRTGAALALALAKGRSLTALALHSAEMSRVPQRSRTHCAPAAA